MTNILHILALIFAFGRLIELLGIDRITEKLRTRFPSYLWGCARCLSIWAGLIVTIFFIVCPWANWPLALSWLYIAYKETAAARGGRKLTVVVKDGQLTWNNKLSNEELVAFVNAIVSPAPAAQEVTHGIEHPTG